MEHVLDESGVSYMIKDEDKIFMKIIGKNIDTI